jgi:hypothetical protein
VLVAETSESSTTRPVPWNNHRHYYACHLLRSNLGWVVVHAALHEFLGT